MFLTDKERDKFARYLEQDAADNDRLATQMEKLPGTFVRASVDLLRRDVAAFMYVAAKLRSVESQTVGGGTEKKGGG